MQPAEQPTTPQWDHSSDPDFYHYYEQQSLSPATLERFAVVREKVLRLARTRLKRDGPFAVADIGCGAGTQARLWAKLGHTVIGLDINAPLLELAGQRAVAEGVVIDFRVGSATELPLPDASMDICLLPELLEHVPGWEAVLQEAVRVLRPNGVLYLSTTNVLCPRQQEFELPFYSWYPGFLKRRYEKLAVTTRPELVNHARYPALHWFSFYQLRNWLQQHNVEARDRFDMMDTGTLGSLNRMALCLLRALPPLRFLGHVMTSYTVVFGVKALR